MSWPEQMDPALQDYITERQSRALRVYEEDHDLLVEHVRQEDSFRSGGYGARQIPELLQNAVDALARNGAPGRIEFRLADGALYCANEGLPFDQAGVRAVTYAFLSGKRQDEIGRFGLGFKSILGITANPQVFSHSVSFEFNADGTQELFAGIPNDSGRLPLLRIPSLADPARAMAEDRHLAELMSWATTVIKLPLQREGARIHHELTEGFEAESLLFLDAIDELRITTLDAHQAPRVRAFRREIDALAGTVTLTAPVGDPVVWLYEQRQYEPSEEVASTLPETMRRKRMTVSYAVNPEKRSEVGQLWSWFPLQDKTTAGGRFNAPWQINDDRTTLVAHSALNGALLEVAAELFLDVAVRASSRTDPAAHLDLFPARGREARSRADAFLSEAIPRHATRRKMIPDRRGELRSPSYFDGIPDLEAAPLSREAVAEWNRLVDRDTVPHEACFGSDARRLRLRSLLRGDSGSSRERSLAAWVEEPVAAGTHEGVAGALRVAEILTRSRGIRREDVLRARIVPLEDGGRASLDRCMQVLLPRHDEQVPSGIELVARDVIADEDSEQILRRFGFREVSADEVARSLLSGLSARSDEQAWAQFWNVASAASPSALVIAFEAARADGTRVRVLTRAGVWREACDVFADGAFVPHLDVRHVHADLAVGRQVLLAAGCLDGPRVDVMADSEPFFADWANMVHQEAKTVVAARGGLVRRTELTDILATTRGAGPLALFTEGLTEEEIVDWTARLIRSMRARELALQVPADGIRGEVTVNVPSLEWWAILQRGQVMTTLGPRPATAVVGTLLGGLASFLPVVVGGDLAGAMSLPRALGDVPRSILTEFLQREDYPVTAPAGLAEILAECATRPAFRDLALVPAIKAGRIRLTPPTEVIITVNQEEVEEAEELGLAHVPGGLDDGTFERVWGMEAARQVFSRQVEAVGVDPEIPVTDIYPSLATWSTKSVRDLRIVRANELIQVRRSPRGQTRRPVRSALGSETTVLVDRNLDAYETLDAIATEARLGLGSGDIAGVLRDDEKLRRSELIARAAVAGSDAERLLILAGRDALEAALPQGLLQAVELRSGELDDVALARLFLRTHGNDALHAVRRALQDAGISMPTRWDGSPDAQMAVKRLGFTTAYAGVKEVRPPNVTQVPGVVMLNRLHDFQADLADQITDLVTTRQPDGHSQRGLLYLPTGAGKTRVTVEAILRMLKEGALESPVLWVAQSTELCEQAIQSFSEVWRWLGDSRPLDVSRFWSGYELDESNQELQVVVAIDDTLDSRLGEAEYAWLKRASLVVIDEAHTAGDSPTYTRILRHLGLSASSTARPLLGLTATPFKGRNPEVNSRFVARFGNTQLRSEMLGEDPIEDLRRRKVLSEVDHAVLKGMMIAAGDAVSSQMRDVTKTALSVIGQDMQRTQNVVDDIVRRTQEAVERNEGFPVLVFAASVASAHTIAALLEVNGVSASAVDGSMRMQERRRVVQRFRDGEIRVLVNCDLLTQGFDAPKVRALYIARPTFSPNRYLQMVGRGLRGPANGGTERCLVVNVEDTFEQFGEQLAYNEFDYLWSNA